MSRDGEWRRVHHRTMAPEPKKKPRRVKESQPAKHPVQDGGGGNEIIRDGVRAVIKS